MSKKSGKKGGGETPPPPISAFDSKTRSQTRTACKENQREIS